MQLDATGIYGIPVGLDVRIESDHKQTRREILLAAVLLLPRPTQKTDQTSSEILDQFENRGSVLQL